MRPLQSVHRRTGFETLEAKTLFAADLMGGAAIDLPDTTIVDGFGSLSPASIGLVNENLGGQEGEDIAHQVTATIAPANANGHGLHEPSPYTFGDTEFDPGDLASVQMNPGDAAIEFSARVFDRTGGFSYFGNLGGQEGEDFNSQTDTNFDYPVGDFVVDGDGGIFGIGGDSDPGGLTSVQINPGDAAIEFSARVLDGTGGFSYAENLGGQEGEPITGTINDGLADSPNLGVTVAAKNDAVKSTIQNMR